MKSISMVAVAALALSGCMSMGKGDGASGSPSAEGTCNTDPVQYHVGHKATQAMGAAIQSESGARTLRWGAPDSAWTMDYRPDRVNVRYDGTMTIIEITCG